MKLALFKLNHLGDNVAFLPAFQALRTHRPDWAVFLLTCPSTAALYEGPFAPSKVWTCQKEAFDKSYRKPWKLAAWMMRVRASQPDACLVPFDQSNAAHWVARHSGAKSRIGACAEGIRIRNSLTHKVEAPGDERPITWNWTLATALVASIGGPGDWPESPPRPDLSHLTGATILPRSDKKRVIVHPGSRLGLNRWPTERFAELATRLASDFEVIWVQDIADRSPVPEGAAGASIKDLRDLVSWLSSADLFVGNNSGPLHVADALGIRGVVVSGPTARGWDPHWQPERWTVLRHPLLSCCPCERLTRTTTVCTHEIDPMACMKLWTAGMVEEACRNRLAS